MGRPPVKLDWDEIGKLIMAGCPTSAIAAQFGVVDKTLYTRCETDLGIKLTEFTQEKRSKGDNLLRAKQYSVAMEGDRSMLIWLGKNRLEQKDQTEVSASLTVNTINYADANISDDTSQVSAEELSAQGDESPGSGD